MKRTFLKLLCTALCIILIAIPQDARAQQISMTIDNQSPGWLSSKIGYEDQLLLENLKVTGYLNKDDLLFIRRLMELHSLHGKLDLEDANIVNTETGSSNYLDTGIFGQANSEPRYQLQYLSIPKTLSSGYSEGLSWLDLDTLYINTTTGFTQTLKATVKHIKYGDNTTVLEYPSFGDVAEGKIETIEFPVRLKEIRERRNTNGTTTPISCKITNGKNLSVFPSLERLFQSFAVEEMPDSIFLPNIRVLSLNQYHSYSGARMFKKGMHVFIGENIDTLTNMLSAEGIHLHFAANKPPVIEGSDYYHYQPYNSEYILYVPKGSAGAYRAIFRNGGTKVIIIEETTDVSEVMINRQELSINVGDTYPLSVNVTPANATDKSVEWVSNNEEVAEVDSKGVITAKKAGNATITVSSVSNPGVMDVCVVTVIQPAKDIQLNETSLTLIQGNDTEQLIATLSPYDTTDKTVLWSSSDINVVEVDDNGLVTAKKKGKAIVTAMAASNLSINASCEVNVIQPVTGISLSESAVEMKGIGTTKQLTAYVEPDDASDKTVNWNSSNPSVCMVAGNGMVVATAEGISVVTAVTVDGSFVAVCVVTVTKAAATGLFEISVENIDGNMQIFTEDGRRIPAPCQGVNVLKLPDGTTKKILIID